MMRVTVHPSEHDYVTVLAGGSGTRLWPLSRSARPKQLLPLANERSLLQNTLQRTRLAVPPERTLILTEASHSDELREHASEIPPENIIVEPARRGTAGALALGASIIQQRDPDAVMASVHSDAYIQDDEQFAQTLVAALRAAEASRTLVTLGIRPTSPSSQFGYIQAAEKLAELDGFDLHRVEEFKEKPTLATAEAYLAAGNYYWNPGVFVWLTSVILNEFRELQPGIAEVLSRIDATSGTPSQLATIRELYPTVPVQTIDNGIMELSKRVSVIPATFGWADIGSWSELYDILPKDANGNVSVGSHVLLDSKNTLAFSHGRTIATIGVDDLVIIDTGDAILVARRGRASESKDIVEYLGREGRTELL
ncbi:MAG: mannose-1-phosphate guanylyltransferase [Chloroflexota bacterium]